MFIIAVQHFILAYIVTDAKNKYVFARKEYGAERKKE